MNIAHYPLPGSPVLTRTCDQIVSCPVYITVGQENESSARGRKMSSARGRKMSSARGRKMSSAREGRCLVQGEGRCLVQGKEDV